MRVTDKYYKKIEDVDLSSIPENKLVELIDSDYMYDCWRQGENVGVRKSGKWAHNAGMKGIYMYDCISKKMQTTNFKSLHELTMTFD